MVSVHAMFVVDRGLDPGMLKSKNKNVFLLLLH
jgi:hypothetical protein